MLLWQDDGMKLDAIGIIVRDLAEAAAFYRLLGLEFPEPGPEEGHVEAVGPGGMRIMLDTESLIQSLMPEWQAPVGGHRVGLAFLCDSPEEVDRLCSDLQAKGAGVLKEPFDAFWGQRYAVVLDPSGNPVDLFAPLE